jgi:hypothetical protein
VSSRGFTSSITKDIAITSFFFLPVAYSFAALAAAVAASASPSSSPNKSSISSSFFSASFLVADALPLGKQRPLAGSQDATTLSENLVTKQNQAKVFG